MTRISNDEGFRQALHGLDDHSQRVVAAMFAGHVLPLSNDQRLQCALKVAVDKTASQDELVSLKSARTAAMDSHTRCGAEGDWREQAGYSVARAAVAALTPPAQSKSANPACQAAMSCRMARTGLFIDDGSAAGQAHSENEWQYQLLSKYLNS